MDDIIFTSSASAMSPIPKRTFMAFSIGNVDEAIALAVEMKADAIVYDPRFSGMTQADVDKIQRYGHSIWWKNASYFMACAKS